MSAGAIVGAWPVNRGNLSAAVLTQRTNTGPQVDGTPSMPSDQWQPKDADLSALAALTGMGLAARTGTDAWALRTLVAGSGSLVVSNGSGAAGNPSIDTAQDIRTTATPQFARLGLGASADADAIAVFARQAARAASLADTTLHLSGADAAFNVILCDAYGQGTFMSARRSNGTAALPTALALDDVIFSFAARGYGATGYSTAGRAQVLFRASEAWTDAAQGTYISFATTITGGVSNSERARFSGAGNLLVGTASDIGITGSGALKVNNALMIATATSFGNGAAAAGGTLTNAPAAGNPTKWIPIYDNGTTRYIPAW